ncbi:hypothetical protein HK099_001786, partial [Clydaea vesicula]
IGACDDDLDIIGKKNPTDQIKYPISLDVIADLVNESWNIKGYKPWFICDEKIFSWYCRNHKEMMVKTLNTKINMNYTYTHNCFNLPEVVELKYLLGQFNCLNLIKILVEEGLSDKIFKNNCESLLISAVYYNRLEILSFLNNENNLAFTSFLYDLAAVSNNLELVTFFDSIKVQPTRKALDWSSYYGYKQVVEFLCANQKLNSNLADAITYAKMQGFFDIVNTITKAQLGY